MSEPIPILMNARAGALHSDSDLGQFQKMARQAGVDADILITHSPAEMKNTLKRLVTEERERVGIAGGDGTVGMAIQELAHTKTALGILSQGTFNNFATALRLPHNLPAALQTLQNGVIRAVDLGKVGDHYFTESAGLGLFADSLALYGTGSNKNFLRGLYALARIGLTFPQHDVRITIDGEVHSGRVLLCEVANTYRIAQAVPVAPTADMADGLLDVVIIGEIKRTELVPYLRALRAQMHLGLPKVSMFRAREVRFEAERPRNVHTDDRITGKTPVTISVQPQALKVLVDEQL